MWVTLATTCHQLRDKTYLQKQLDTAKMITLFSFIIHHSHRCFQNHIYMLLTSFTNMFLIPQQLRIFPENFHHHHHGNCRILANGMWIWHLECCYWLPAVWGRRPWPDHPRHSFRMFLHHLLLDTHKPHTTTATWRCSIWTFRYCTQCSIYPAVISGRWRLQQWFQHWPTNTFMQNTMHTPCLQHGTCILWLSAHYTPPPSYHVTLQHTTDLTQTNVLPPNICFWQLREWPGSRQLIRPLIRWRRRLPNSTYGWWTLDNRNGTRKDILHTWKWVTQQCMPIPMPLWE